MAKAKKTTGDENVADKKPAATKAAKTAKKQGTSEVAPAKGAGKKSASSKKSAGSATTSGPTIDTGLAAQAAASAIMNRSTGASGAPASAGAGSKESASFKAFKQGVNKPQGPGGMLGNAFQQKKGAGNQSFGGGKQVGHNQTFGADINRTGVPRRTSG